MNFINFFILIIYVFSVSCCKKSISEILPEYRLIKKFSRIIQPRTNLALYSYSVNNCLPNNHEFKNKIENFSAGYFLCKTKNDIISLEEARSLIISVAEGLLKEINSDSEVRSILSVYPFNADLVSIAIHFKDENKIDLGQGISMAYLSKGKIKYERYEIHEYRSKYPSIGKHFIVHNESYAEALDIVKSQNSLIDLGSLRPIHVK